MIADRPRIVGGSRFLQERSCVGEGSGHLRVGPAFQGVPVGVSTAEEETGQGELAERLGGTEGSGAGGAVQIRQHRPGSLVAPQSVELLAGVFDGEEERLGGPATDGGQGFEEIHRRLG